MEVFRALLAHLASWQFVILCSINKKCLKTVHPQPVKAPCHPHLPLSEMLLVLQDPPGAGASEGPCSWPASCEPEPLQGRISG